MPNTPPAIETTWSEVAQSQEEIKTLAWIDLIREADNVRKRKEGKPYGSSWHRNIGIAIRGVPFTLQEASPQTIRAWIKELQDAGLSGLTINNKCSLLSGVIQTSIKSGLLEGQTNPFDQVDYAASSTRHIYTATEADYRAALRLMKALPMKQRLVIELCIYCGCRINEVMTSKRENYDLEQGLMTITDAKNQASERTIPIPPGVCKRLKEFDFGWGSNAATNNRLKKINPELTSHSFRHGFTQFGRELKVDPTTVEAMLGHRLSISDMANVYGDGYSPETLREAIQPIWDWLDN